MRWTAPEVLVNPQSNEQDEGGVFTTACDVYSYGIVMWEVATGAVPYEDLVEEDLVRWSLKTSKCVL